MTVYYIQEDLVDTAREEDLNRIANARKLTRMYYSTDYKDTEERRAILAELLDGIGENVAIDTPFHCDYGKNIILAIM